MNTRVKQTFCGSQWRSDAPLKIKSSLIKQIIHLLYFQHNAKQEKKPRCAIICYRAHYATWERDWARLLDRMLSTRVGNCFESKTIIVVSFNFWPALGWFYCCQLSLKFTPCLEGVWALPLPRVSHSRGAVACLTPQKALKFQVANQPVDGAPRELGFNCLWV